MKFRIIPFMTGYAIQRRRFIFWKFIRHGDYFPAYHFEDEGKVMKHETREGAKTWIITLIGGVNVKVD